MTTFLCDICKTELTGNLDEFAVKIEMNLAENDQHYLDEFTSYLCKDCRHRLLEEIKNWVKRNIKK